MRALSHIKFRIWRIARISSVVCQIEFDITLSYSADVVFVKVFKFQRNLIAVRPFGAYFRYGEFITVRNKFTADIAIYFELAYIKIFVKCMYSRIYFLRRADIINVSDRVRSRFVGYKRQRSYRKGLGYHLIVIVRVVVPESRVYAVICGNNVGKRFSAVLNPDFSVFSTI